MAKYAAVVVVAGVVVVDAVVVDATVVVDAVFVVAAVVVDATVSGLVEAEIKDYPTKDLIKNINYIKKELYLFAASLRYTKC